MWNISICDHTFSQDPIGIYILLSLHSLFQVLNCSHFKEVYKLIYFTWYTWRNHKHMYSYAGMCLNVISGWEMWDVRSKKGIWMTHTNSLILEVSFKLCLLIVIYIPKQVWPWMTLVCVLYNEMCRKRKEGMTAKELLPHGFI